MDTSGISPDAGTTLGIPDRRAHARQRVSSIACIELGESNGGIVVNVSEGGLALAAVEVLSPESLPRIRVQPPRSRDWTEISAQIAWISESRKEAGIQFDNLTEESRDRIREWISEEVAASESRWGKAGVPRETPPPPSTPIDQAPAPDMVSSAAENPSLAADEPVSQALPQPIPQQIRECSELAETAETSPRTPDRRLRPRRRVKSLAYIRLGDSNGGIITNLSEEGLRVQAAVALAGGPIPLMRFQSPLSGDRIEVGGKVAWISDSGLEAGIQFIELPEEERANLRGWVASEPPSIEIRPVKENAGETRNVPRESSKVQEPSSVLGESVAPDRGVCFQPPVAAGPSPAIYPAPLMTAEAETPLPASSARPIFADPTEARPRRWKARRRMNSAMQRRTWQVIAAVLAIAAAISFFVGWNTARRDVRNDAPAITGIKNAAASEPTASVPPSPAGPISRPSSDGAENARVQGHPAAPARAPGGNGVATFAARNAAPESKAPLRAFSPLKYAAAPSQGSSVAQQAQSGPAPAPTETEIPEIPPGEVSISFLPFPSVRVPAELRSQAARVGTGLRIGQVISRVTPVYPEEMRRQRIEGTVKLRANIRKDGTVQSVSLLSGPESLAPPAIKALLEWRYKPTMLGSQQIETVDDITFVFRLENPADNSN